MNGTALGLKGDDGVREQWVRDSIREWVKDKPRITVDNTFVTDSLDLIEKLLAENEWLKKDLAELRQQVADLLECSYRERRIHPGKYVKEENDALSKQAPPPVHVGEASEDRPSLDEKIREHDPKKEAQGEEPQTPEYPPTTLGDPPTIDEHKYPNILRLLGWK